MALYQAYSAKEGTFMNTFFLDVLITECKETLVIAHIPICKMRDMLNDTNIANLSRRLLEER